MSPEAALDILIGYCDMLRAARGHDPAGTRTMILAYRDWEAGDCDSGSGVADSDLDTRLSRCLLALTGVSA